MVCHQPCLLLQPVCISCWRDWIVLSRSPRSTDDGSNPFLSSHRPARPEIRAVGSHLPSRPHLPVIVCNSASDIVQLYEAWGQGCAPSMESDWPCDGMVALSLVLSLPPHKGDLVSSVVWLVQECGKGHLAVYGRQVPPPWLCNGVTFHAHNTHYILINTLLGVTITIHFWVFFLSVTHPLGILYRNLASFSRDNGTSESWSSCHCARPHRHY